MTSDMDFLDREQERRDRTREDLERLRAAVHEAIARLAEDECDRERVRRSLRAALAGAGREET